MTSAELPSFHLPQPLPHLADILAATTIVRVPMRLKFRGVTFRESALIKGPAGWGEFAPFREYGTRESSVWLASALEAAWLGFPGAVRQQVAVNATVPAVAPHEVEIVLAHYAGEIREVKIKVAERSQNIDDDVARVAAVRSAVPTAGLKIDANAGWNVEQAVEALESLAEFDLLYAEQPVAGIEGLARVRQELRARGIDLPLAADESVRKATDPLRVAQRGAADILIVKVAPLGGVRRALEIVERAGLPAVVSSALESSVGISAGLALAASLPELPYGCGLGTVSLMEEDTVEDSLAAHNGLLVPRRVEPSPLLLQTLSVDQFRQRWWLRRIEDCYRHLSKVSLGNSV